VSTFIVVQVSFLAIVLSTLTAVFGTDALVYVFPIIVAATILIDYRIAVVLLALMLPFQSSPLLPQTQGFNPITYGVIAAIFSLIIRHFYELKSVVVIPRVVILCVVVPLIAGVLLAWPHLDQGMRNFSEYAWNTNYEPSNFVKLHFIRPLTFLLFAVLVANAVKDSRTPENFIWVFAVAALLPVIGIFGSVLAGGFSLADLAVKRNFLGMIGLHSNGAGKLIAFAFGPLLWVTFSMSGIKRSVMGIATCLVLAGVLLTMTRGAYVAVAVVVSIFLWQRRQIWPVMLALGIGAIFLVAGPDEFLERVTRGVDWSTFEEALAGNPTDKLTAGRLGGYQLLAPEVLKSPLWGSGTGSTAWSSAVAFKAYISNHPHNMYLSAAMDIGLIGLMLTLYFYYAHIRAMRILSAHSSLSPPMRAFFAGSAAGIMGILVYSFTNGVWFPEGEQSYMWLAYGMLYAYWRLSQGVTREGKTRLAHEQKDIVLSPNRIRQSVVGGK
jgi:O-antigen ligase